MRVILDATPFECVSNFKYTNCFNPRIILLAKVQGVSKKEGNDNISYDKKKESLISLQK